MAWQKSSADLVGFFRQIVPSGPGIEQKQMFGYPCAFVNGKLFTGLFQQSLLFRLSPADQAAFLDHPGSAEFEPLPGRKMKGFVVFDDPFSVAEEELANWIQCALQFASQLPAKKKKASVKKKLPVKKKKA